MYKSIPIFSRVIAILTVVSTLFFSIYEGGFVGLILSAVIWAFIGFMLPRLKIIDMSNYFVFYGLLVATAIIAISAPFITNNFASEKDSSESDSLTAVSYTHLS